MAEESTGEKSAEDEAGFFFFSFGDVAENKEVNSNIIQVTPSEKLPNLEGELRESRDTVEVEGKDASGNVQKASTTASPTVEAEWYSENGNQMTSPDVRRGERVELWRYSDSDKYYWKSTNMTINLRRLETVTLRYGATPEGDKDVELNSENCYIIEASGHNKTLTITTSKANGEKAAFRFQLNGGDGQAILMDDKGQEIVLDTEESLVHLKNAADSEIKLSKDKILFKCTGDMEFDVGGGLIGKVAQDIKWTSQQNNVVAEASYGVKSPSANFAVGSWGYTNESGGSGKMTFDGDINIVRTFKVGGLTTLSGGADVKQTLTANKITTPNPIDAPNV